MTLGCAICVGETKETTVCSFAMHVMKQCVITIAMRILGGYLMKINSGIATSAREDWVWRSTRKMSTLNRILNIDNV